MLKYNYHSVKYIFRELTLLLNWFGFLVNNFLNFLKTVLSVFFKKLRFLSVLKNSNDFIIKLINTNLFNLLVLVESDLNKLEYTQVWQYLNHHDESFLKYFSKLYFINQFFSNR